MPAEGEEHRADRDLDVLEGPLDAANQSLADALRASFSILKGIMLVLCVLYAFSNVRRVESHEQALRLRLGRLLPHVHEAGLVLSFPYPIDEFVRLPTKKSNDAVIDSHSFMRSADEVGKPLSFIHRGSSRGLHPVLDGALLTADAGLVHVRWKITYKIDDVASYIREIIGDSVEAAQNLIRTYVETVGVHIASGLTAEEIVRTRVDYVQGEMRRLINEELAAINSGITVTHVEMFEPTPPLQVRESFDNTQRAENTKQQKIREAEEERTRLLNEAAGAAHARLLAKLDEIEAAGDDAQRVAALRAELDRLLQEEAEGKAGRLIKDAGAYHSVVVGRMQSDVDLYRRLLPEYERNPALLVGRLFEQATQVIFKNPGVTKVYYPPDLRELRFKIKRDPQEAREAEKRRVEEKEFDAKKINRGQLKPFGPGNW